MLFNFTQSRVASPSWLLDGDSDPSGGPRGILGVARLSALLRSLGLRRRASLAESCGERLRSTQFAKLFWDVFGRLSRYSLDNPWEISFEFAGEIHNERFPLNLNAMDQFAESEENPLYYDIMPQGYGVYWEGLSIGHIAEAARPLVAIWVMSGNVLFGPENDYSDEEMIEGIADWLDTLNPGDLPATKRGYEFTWPVDTDGVRLMRERLAALPEPLDGLATLLTMVAKDSGNPFLDIPDTQMHYFEDHPWGGFYYPWSVENIEKLTELYLAVKEEIEEVRTFVRWVGCSTNRVHQVMTELIMCGIAVDKEINDEHFDRGKPKTLVELFAGEQSGPGPGPERLEPAD